MHSLHRRSIMFSALQAAFTKHLESLKPGADKKELLTELQDSKQWQEFVERLVVQTEDNIFEDEYKMDVRKINTSALLKMVNPCNVVIAELEARKLRAAVREEFEQWVYGGCVRDPDNKPSSDCARLHMYPFIQCFVDKFDNSFLEWDIELYLDNTRAKSMCKEEKAMEKAMQKRVALHMLQEGKYKHWMADAMDAHSDPVRSQNINTTFCDLIKEKCTYMFEFVRGECGASEACVDALEELKENILEGYGVYAGRCVKVSEWVEATLAMLGCFPDDDDVYAIFEQGLQLIKAAPKSLFKARAPICLKNKNHPPTDRMKQIITSLL